MREKLISTLKYNAIQTLTFYSVNILHILL